MNAFQKAKLSVSRTVRNALLVIAGGLIYCALWFFFYVMQLEDGE